MYIHLQAWDTCAQTDTNPFSSPEVTVRLVSTNLDVLELWELDKHFPSSLTDLIG